MTGPTPADPDLRSGSVATQSKNALGLAWSLGLLTYRMPVEVRSAESIARLLAEVGNDASVPTDDAVYYWVWVPVEHGEGRQDRQAILIPEGEVRAFCLALAARAGLAHRFNYRDGVVPR